MMRAFSRVRPAQDALNEYRERIKRLLQNDKIPFRVISSRDRQRARSTTAEYGPALDRSIKTLNKELKEPSELVFFSGGIYECTINDSCGRYNQSQLAFMLDIPSQDAVERFASILLWITPSGMHTINFNHRNIPSRNYLITSGWREIMIGCAPERLVITRGGLQAKSLQYS